MLYREIIAVCSDVHTKHINTLCGLNVEFLDIKLDGQVGLVGCPGDTRALDSHCEDDRKLNIIDCGS
jgi:hypothetical protein